MTRLHTILAVLMMAGLSCAQGGWVEDTPNGTIIHIKVWQLPDSANPETYTQSEVAGVELFRQRFPEIFQERWAAIYKANPEKYGVHNWDNVSIELHQATGISVEGVESDLLQIAGGLSPDVLYVNFRKSDNYIQNSFLYPLDEYLDMMTQEQIDFRVNAKLWPVIRRIGPSGKKHTWAFPYGGALGKVLLFRKDLFDAHDLPYPDVNYTWDDMLHACKTITDPAKGVYGIELGKGKHESWYFVTFLWSAGADVMSYDEPTNTWSCVFGTPAAARALDFYLKLSAEKWIDQNGTIRRGYSTKDSSESASAKWINGEIGMKMSYIDERLFARINPELTGMVPVPLGAPDPETGERIRGGELNSRMLGLFSAIEQPAVRDAAWEYIRFYDSMEATRLKTRIMVEGGYGRFVNPRLLREFGYPEVERLAPPGWSETFEVAVATGRPEPYGKNSNYAYDLLTIPIQEAEDMMRGDELPQEDDARLARLESLLAAANQSANEKMIGTLTPAEQLERRITAWAVLLAILSAFGFVFRRIVSTFTPPESRQPGKAKWAFRRYKWAYVLLLPGVVTVLIWQYVPLARGSVMAFYDYKLLGKSVFIGVDNFGDLLYDNAFWASIWHALRYSFLVLALTFLPPMILAIALQEVPRGKLIYRLIFYLPAVITGIITALLWKQFYEPSERGALNAIIMNVPAIGFIALGLFLLAVCVIFARRLMVHEMRLAAGGFLVAGFLLFMAAGNFAWPILTHQDLPFLQRLFSYTPEPYLWLRDANTAMIACVIPMVWAGMGPGCLIYLAALKGIPEDYYEAADLDGATFVDKILFVVFPMLKALIIINFVGAFISCWYTATGNILVMTGGGYDTEVVGLHIWYKAFTFLQFGPATAAAWMLGFMLIGFTVHQLRILSRVEFKTASSKD